MASMGPIEGWKKQSHEIWTHLGYPPRNHKGSPKCACTKCPPPCSIGLTSTSGAQALPTTSEDANFEDNPDNYENDVESKFNFLQTGQKPSIFCFHEKNIPIVNH